VKDATAVHVAILAIFDELKDLILLTWQSSKVPTVVSRGGVYAVERAANPRNDIACDTHGFDRRRAPLVIPKRLGLSGAIRVGARNAANLFR
jgi:hypothetical protein